MPRATCCLEWFFLHAALKQMGFGKKFRRWVEVLCQDVSAEVIVNGELTRLLWLLRSVRQGCPFISSVPVCLSC